MKKLILCILFISVLPVFSQEIYNRTLILMGSRFDISVVSNNSNEADTYINIADSIAIDVGRSLELFFKWI